MRVLALDLARNSGWAVVDGTHTVALGSWNLLENVRTTGRNAPPLETQHVIQVQALRGSVLAVIDNFCPDVVAIEKEFGRGVGTRLLVSLFTGAQEAAYVAGLPCLAVTIGQWRKHIYGSAAGKTAHFKEAARMLVPEAPDADAAEAVLIGRYVAATARIRPAQGRAA